MKLSQRKGSDFVTMFWTSSEWRVWTSLRGLSPVRTADAASAALGVAWCSDFSLFPKDGEGRVKEGAGLFGQGRESKPFERFAVEVFLSARL